MAEEIVSTVTGAFTTFITGIGSSIVAAFDSIFTTSEGKLSNLAIWGLTFAGVGLATFIVKKFVGKAG